VLYDKLETEGTEVIYHGVFARLIQEKTEVEEKHLKVTYHDPCHLGRLENFIHWEKQISGHMVSLTHPKFQRGAGL
jgi:Fe-S oxidoreductase